MVIWWVIEKKDGESSASLDHHYTEKDSPQPHVPLIFGLLKTNSEASLQERKINNHDEPNMIF